MPQAIPGPAAGGAGSPVQHLLTALGQGLNPFAAAVLALNQAFGWSLGQPPGASPSFPAPAVTGSAGTVPRGVQAPGGRGAGGAPPPPPPPPVCKPQRCPNGWFWDSAACACQPRPGFF